MPESAKKHKIRVNPRKESVRDSVEVRRAFFLAFNAFPASSPSTPKSNVSILDCFFFFRCSSPVLRIASSGVILLSFLAGSHAENRTVITEEANVNANTSGWYLKPNSYLPGIFSAMAFIA